MFISSMVIVFILLITLLTLMFLLKMKAFTDYEQKSPFECGFIPQEPARTLFSMHFFLIAILFLIFDVELVLLFPIFSNFFWSSFNAGIFLIMLLLLILGLFYEWSQSMLEWSNFK